MCRQQKSHVKRWVSGNKLRLHFSNSSQEQARKTPNFGCLYKVHTIVNYALNKFRSNLKPSKSISVDEGMIAFRGRLSFQQFMPAERTKYGIKVWMSGEANNGCILNGYLDKEAGQRCSSFNWDKYLFWFMVDIPVCSFYFVLSLSRKLRGSNENQVGFRTNLASQFNNDFSFSSTTCTLSKEASKDNGW